MGNPIKKIIVNNKHFQAFIRPFSSSKSNVISPQNKIVSAYIFDWDNNLSENNHLVKSEIEIKDEEANEVMSDNNKGTK